MQNNYQLINGDCLDEMKSIQDNSVDLILCDLPYGTTDTSKTKKSEQNRLFSWDCVIPLDELWKQYTRILNKEHGVVVLTADQPFTSQLVMSNLEWFKYDWIWKKKRTTGFLHANHRPMKQTEDILVFSPLGASAASSKAGKSMRYNPQGLIPKNVKKTNSPNRLGNFLRNDTHMGKNNMLLSDKQYEQKFTNYPTEILEFGIKANKYHPTQKPIELMEYLIKTYSNEGDLVLDNCMGSGTTGIAAINTNRKFIGIELSKEYFDISSERISKVNPITKFS